MAQDPRVDTYIGRARPFARPVLSRIRVLVHRACPEVQETIKWGFPHFDYKGMMCSMAAFKEHCAMTFWKAALLPDAVNLQKSRRQAMGHLGRIGSVLDLPPDTTLLRWIRIAARLNEQGTKVVRKRKKTPKPAPRAPAWFMTAVRKRPAALKTFQALSASHKREYIEWLKEAKTTRTRERRLATVVAWLAEGKSRNWKYDRRK